jgi:hypothetical protein
MPSHPDPTQKAPGDDGNIVPALWAVALAGVVLALAAAFLFGRGAVVSSLIGSALAVANLWSIGRMVRGFLGGAGARAWGPLGMLKLLLLFAVLGVIVKQGFADVLPLAFGYAALPVGIVLAQLRVAPPVREEN